MWFIDANVNAKPMDGLDIQYRDEWISSKWRMNNGSACIITHQCLHIPPGTPSFHVSIHTFIMAACSYYLCGFVCIYMCVCHCASMYSLIPLKARIWEGLQLDGWLCNLLSNLGLDDSSINGLLEVDKAPVVAHCLPGPDVGVLHKIGVPYSVSAHDIVHVHADGVANFGRQRWCGDGPGWSISGI